MLTVFAIALGIILLFVILLGSVIQLPENRLFFRFLFFAIVVDSALLAYCTAPYSGSDLSRYFTEIGMFNRLGLEYMPNSLYADTPLTAYFIWLISVIGDSHLLASISAALTVGIFLLVLAKQEKLYKQGTLWICRMILFILAYVSVLSLLISVRQFLAISVFSAILWYDLGTKEHRTTKWYKLVILYCIPLLIHYGVALLCVIRVIVFLFSQNKRVQLVALVIICFTSALVCQTIISNNISGLLGTIADKFFDYGSITVRDQRVYALSLGSAVLYLLFAILSNARNPNSSYNWFCVLTAVASLCFFMNYHLMIRTAACVSFCMYPLIYSVRRPQGRYPARELLLFLLFVLFGVLKVAYQFVSITNQWQFTWI